MSRINGYFVSFTWLAIFVLAISSFGWLHDQKVKLEFSQQSSSLYQIGLAERIAYSKTLLRIDEDEAGTRTPYYGNIDTPGFLYYGGWLLTGSTTIQNKENRDELAGYHEIEVLSSIFRSKKMLIKNFNWIVEVLPLVLMGTLAVAGSLLITLGRRFHQHIGLMLGLGSGFAWGFDVSFAYGLVVGLAITITSTFGLKDGLLGILTSVSIGVLAGAFPGYTFNTYFGLGFGLLYGLSFGATFWLIHQTKALFGPVCDYIRIELYPEDSERKDFILLSI